VALNIELAASFILNEQREPLAEENEAASNWERTRIEECLPKNCVLLEMRGWRKSHI
jgi:hypothetical protein